jgi:hypothetical protein
MCKIPIPSEAYPSLSYSAGRQRDIFPLSNPALGLLPHVGGSEPPLSHSLSAKSRQRRGVRRCRVDLVTAAVDAVNWLNDGSFRPGVTPTSTKVTLAQESAHHHVIDSVRLFGLPPADLSPSEALAELRGSLHYDGIAGNHNVVPVDLSLLSLPPVGNIPVPIAKLGYDGTVLTHVQEFCKQILLPTANAKMNLRDAPSQPYIDPRLRHRGAYLKFIRKLRDSAIIDFSSHFLEQVGAFCVSKKNGKQRLVVDARRSNCWFVDPPAVSLATGSALSDITVEDDGGWFIAHLDIANAFYALELPVALRSFFCLPGISARELGLTHLNGLLLRPGDIVYPRLQVVPMGWTHALAVCQQIHEAIVDKAGLLPSHRVIDGQPSIPVSVSVSDPLHVEYVDNFAAIGSSAENVTQALNAVNKLMNDLGLPTHDICDTCRTTDLIGWSLDGAAATIRPTHRRAWKIILAVRALQCNPRGSSKLIERIVGHMSFIALLRRESLSCFNSVYDYIRAKHHSPSHPIPEKVMQELVAFAGVVPLIWIDARAAWSEEVLMCDASTTGRGVVSARVDPVLVRHMASQ